MPFVSQEMNFFEDSSIGFQDEGSTPRGCMTPFLDDSYHTTSEVVQGVDFPEEEEPPVQRCSTPEASEGEEEDNTIIKSFIQTCISQPSEKQRSTRPGVNGQSPLICHPCYIKQYSPQKQHAATLANHSRPLPSNCFLKNGSLAPTLPPPSYPRRAPDVFADALNSYQVEGTPRDSVCNTPPPAQETQDAEDEVFTNDRPLHKEEASVSFTPQEDQTPLMFSRSSSLSSLSSAGDELPEFDVVSEYSQQPSQAVSPSDLPDSPIAGSKPASPPTPLRANRQGYPRYTQDPLDLSSKSQPPFPSYPALLPTTFYHTTYGLPHSRPKPPLAHAASKQRIYYTDEQPLDLSTSNRRRSSQQQVSNPPPQRTIHNLPPAPTAKMVVPAPSRRPNHPEELPSSFIFQQARSIMTMLQRMAPKASLPIKMADQGWDDDLVCYATEDTPAYLSASTSRALSPLPDSSRTVSRNETLSYAMEGTTTLSCDASRSQSPQPSSSHKSVEDTILHYAVENTPVLMSGILSPISCCLETSFTEELSKPKEEADPALESPKKSAPEPSPLGSPNEVEESPTHIRSRPKPLYFEKQKSSAQLSPLVEDEEEELPQECYNSPQPCSSASASYNLSSGSEAEDPTDAAKAAASSKKKQLSMEKDTKEVTPMPSLAQSSKAKISTSPVDSEEEEDDDELLMACIIAGMPKSFTRNKKTTNKHPSPEAEPFQTSESITEKILAEDEPAADHPRATTPEPPPQDTKVWPLTSPPSECGSEDSRPARQRPAILHPKPVIPPSCKSVREVNSKGMPRPPILFPKPSKEFLLARGILSSSIPSTSQSSPTPSLVDACSSSKQPSESGVATRPVSAPVSMPSTPTAAPPSENDVAATKKSGTAPVSKPSTPSAALVGPHPKHQQSPSESDLTAKPVTAISLLSSSALGESSLVDSSQPKLHQELLPSEISLVSKPVTAISLLSSSALGESALVDSSQPKLHQELLPSEISLVSKPVTDPITTSLILSEPGACSKLQEISSQTDLATAAPPLSCSKHHPSKRDPITEPEPETRSWTPQSESSPATEEQLSCQTEGCLGTRELQSQLPPKAPNVIIAAEEVSSEDQSPNAIADDRGEDNLDSSQETGPVATVQASPQYLVEVQSKLEGLNLAEGPNNEADKSLDLSIDSKMDSSIYTSEENVSLVIQESSLKVPDFGHPRSKSLDALPQNRDSPRHTADGQPHNSSKAGCSTNDDSFGLSSSSSEDENLLMACIKAGMPSKKQQRLRHKSDRRAFSRAEDGRHSSRRLQNSGTLGNHVRTLMPPPSSRLDSNSAAKLASPYFQDEGSDTEDDRMVQELVKTGIMLARHSSDNIANSLSRRQPHRSSERIQRTTGRGSRVHPQPRSQSQRAFREPLPAPDKSRKSGRSSMFPNLTGTSVHHLAEPRRHLDHVGPTYPINHLADDRYPVPAPVAPPNPQSKRQFDRSLLRALSLREQKSSKGPMPRVEAPPPQLRPADNRLLRPNPPNPGREQQQQPMEMKPAKRWWIFGSRTAKPQTSVFADSTKQFKLP